MTAATLSTWSARSASSHNLDNSPFDVTFVLGNQRVVYNVQALYAGSPYIAPGYSSPTAGRCGYTATFPDDDRFLGSADLVLDWPGGHGGETTAMQEEMGYYVMDKMDLPFCHRYIIRLHVNGVTDDQRNAVFEAVNQPSGEFNQAWVPDTPSGDFYKIDRGFEFNDSSPPGLVQDPQPRLDNWTTTGGVKKTSRYRWNWYKRANDSALDLTNIFNLVDAANATRPQPYTPQLEALADVEEWMGVFAADHIIVNFDCWGHEIGKNMYGFKPDGGKWQFYLFDLDWLMLAAPLHNSTYAASTAPLFISEDPNVAVMYNHPPFRRAYFRAVQNAINGPLVLANCNAVMDAKYNALVANGVQWCDGAALTPPTAVKQWFSDRRTYLLSQLATVAANFSITAPSITTSSNLITLSGTAPITITTIEINGVAWPITWTSVSNWTVRLPVTQPTSQLTVLGLDKHGKLVPGASNQVSVTFTGPLPSAQGGIVFNEIMYHPLLPEAQFVELFNTSSNFAFNIGSWRVHGLGYTFPEGSFIGPRSFLVLVKNRAAALAAYGANLIIFDQFDGNLQTNGETLTLIQPGATPDLDLVIDKVRYESAAPWPVSANGSGPSLQLIDPMQDNSRVANWSGDAGWVLVSKTGNIFSATNLLAWITGAGNAYIDDISLTGADGTNIVLNGDFESDLSPPWLISTNYTSSMIVSNISHSGRRGLFLNGTSGGGNLNTSLQQLIGSRVVTNTTYTLSFWCLANTNTVTVNVRTLPGSSLILAGSTSRVLPTPGAPNLGVTSLPSFPPIWLNEVQPDNLNGIMDSAGQHDPWLELYNSGPNALPLDGYFLANNYTNLTQWSFTAGTVINPGEFKVIFADGEPGETTATELHTSFRLSSGTGCIALSRSYNGGPQVLDYINYNNVTPGRSYGSFPDGQLFDRQEFYYVTPSGTNNGASAPLVVFINEWMASNTRTLADLSSGVPK